MESSKLLYPTETRITEVCIIIQDKGSAREELDQQKQEAMSKEHESLALAVPQLVLG